MPRLLLLPLLVLLTVVTAVPGQSYYNYHPVPYQVPKPAPAPAYPHAYTPEYQYPAQKVIAQEIAVAPLIVTVPVDSKAVPVHAYGNPYYYSVSQAYQEKNYLREVLREELRNLLAGGNQAAPPRPTAPAPPAPAPAPAPANTPSQPAGPPDSFTADTTTPAELQQKVLAAYSGRGSCLNCHGATGAASGPKGKPFRLVVENSKGELVLAKFDSYKRSKIYTQASVGVMPPKAVNDATQAIETQHLPALLQYALQKDE